MIFWSWKLCRARGQNCLFFGIAKSAILLHPYEHARYIVPETCRCGPGTSPRPSAGTGSRPAATFPAHYLTQGWFDSCALSLPRFLSPSNSPLIYTRTVTHRSYESTKIFFYIVDLKVKFSVHTVGILF